MLGAHESYNRVGVTLTGSEQVSFHIFRTKIRVTSKPKPLKTWLSSRLLVLSYIILPIHPDSHPRDLETTVVV